MIYLIDGLPAFCPSCGKKHSKEWIENNKIDFLFGASGQCDCGARYQFVETQEIINASRLNKNGDLYMYTG